MEFFLFRPNAQTKQLAKVPYSVLYTSWLFTLFVWRDFRWRPINCQSGLAGWDISTVAIPGPLLWLGLCRLGLSILSKVRTRGHPGVEEIITSTVEMWGERPAAESQYCVFGKALQEPSPCTRWGVNWELGPENGSLSRHSVSQRWRSGGDEPCWVGLCFSFLLFFLYLFQFQFVFFLYLLFSLTLLFSITHFLSLSYSVFVSFTIYIFHSLSLFCFLYHSALSGSCVCC
jgi:hypothetical protein